MGVLSYPLTGISGDFRPPGTYVEVKFNQGPSTSSAGARKVLFVGPMTSAGTYTANTIVRARNSTEVEDGAGAGSPLHRMVRAFMLKNNVAECWVLPHAETSGGSPIAATGTVTITGTATAAGALAIDVCGEPVTVSYAAGEAAATTGAKLVLAINAKTWLPVTASGTGTVTLTAKIKGTSQGTASVGVIRFRASVQSGAGLSVATSGAALGLGTGTPGAEGSTTEVANLATALAGALATRYYYVVHCNSQASALSAVGTHLVAKALPKNGLRQVAITGYTGTLATAITLATGINYERMAIAWQPNSEHDNAELAGYMAAVRHSAESSHYCYNLDYCRGGQDGIAPVGFVAAYSQSDWPTQDDINDAINGGLTPIGSDATGAYVVMSCSTRSKGAGGTVADFRSTETHRVSGADAVADTLVSRLQAKYGNQRLRSDQYLPNGNVNPNQLLPAGVTTPSRMLPTMYQVLDEFEATGVLQEVATTKAGLQNIKSAVNSGRTEAQLDIRTIDLAHQRTLLINEISPG